MLDGGAGVGYVLADDSAETDDSLGTLTQTTLTGLDMTADSALDPLYSVTAGGAAFSITLAGYGTVALAGGASAAAVIRPRCSTCFPGQLVRDRPFCARASRPLRQQRRGSWAARQPSRDFSVFGVTGSTTIVGTQRVKVPAGTFTTLVLRSTLNQAGYPFGSGTRRRTSSRGKGS